MAKEKKRKVQTPSIIGLQQNPVSDPKLQAEESEVYNAPADELHERQARIDAERARKSA